MLRSEGQESGGLPSSLARVEWSYRSCVTAPEERCIKQGLKVGSSPDFNSCEDSVRISGDIQIITTLTTE